MALPQYIDLIEYVEQQRSIDAVVSSESLERLSELLEQPTKQIVVKLEFGKDAQQRRVVSCYIEAILHVQCQRCGQMMSLPLTVNSKLCMVKNDGQAKQLPVNYEPLMASDVQIVPLNIIEEELLLAIPMVPRHIEAQCPSNLTKDLVH